MLILSLTGCGEKSNKDLSAVYIPVRYEFVSPSGKLSQDGKAYEEIINDEEFDEETKLWYLNSLCFSDDKIEQFDSYRMSKKHYSGEYKITKDDMLDLTYDYYGALSKDGEILYCDLKNDKSNLENSRQKSAIEADIKSASEYDYVKNTIYGWNYNDKSSWLPFPYITSAEHGDIDAVIKGFQANLYHKGDFLVSEQKGYSFDGNISKKQFTLKYDANEIGQPERDYLNCEINFNSDNTWECVYEDRNSSEFGTWEIIHDNLLVIYPSDEEMIQSLFSMLYLDFKDEKVYLPAYMRCDEMNEIYIKYKAG